MSVGSSRDETLQAGQVHPRLIPHGVLVPFVLVTALFFLWGIPNNLNDVLIRQFMKSFATDRRCRRHLCSRRFTWATFCWRFRRRC